MDERQSLQCVLESFFSRLCREDVPEAAFLLVMSHLEKLAGDQITANLTIRTPPHLRTGILAHAADEYRHGVVLRRAAETQFGQNPIPDRVLRRFNKARTVAENFILGYFSNPFLTLSRNRHSAYVHGALTIELFPFHVYTCYLKHTRFESVKRALRDVVADEAAHIQFGQRMHEELPVHERLDIDELNRVEMKMCRLMFERLSTVFFNFTPATPLPQNCLFRLMNEDARYHTAWISALSVMETHRGNEQHQARLLRHSVALNKYRFRNDSGYRRIEKISIDLLLGYQNQIFAWAKRHAPTPRLADALALSTIGARVFKHYSSLGTCSDEILTSFVLGQILDVEKEHGHFLYKELRADPFFSESLYREASAFEDRCFSHLLDTLLSQRIEPQEPLQRWTTKQTRPSYFQA